MTFDEYVEMMRHYFQQLPIAVIRDAYKHNATATEVRRYLERISGKKEQSA